MCDVENGNFGKGESGATKKPGVKTLAVTDAVGAVLAHDITEIRPGEFKGRAFKKGHVIREEDVCHLQRLGKENLFVLNIADDEMHEDDAAHAIANALMGAGVKIKGEPKEGKIDIIAEKDGLLRIDKDALLRFNMLGEVMCATFHNNTVVKKGQTVAATRTIPLVVKKKIVEEAVRIGMEARNVVGAPLAAPSMPQKEVEAIHELPLHRGVIEVQEIRKASVGVVITGSEVYYGKIKDAFAPVIKDKIHSIGGEIVGMYYAPDDQSFIEDRLRELINAGADLLITTGGMSVDPDDVTRFAIRNLGATDFTYGSAVLPGAMFLVAYVQKSDDRRQMTDGLTATRLTSNLCPQPSALSPLPSDLIPILGIPACGMYASTTVFDLVLPRILSGEKIGRRELAELGHGGLCMKCEPCRYPVCPFGK